jgi:LAO/AO transport system kinase
MIWESIQQYSQLTQTNGYFEQRRLQQAKYWMYETIRNSLVSHFYLQPDIEALLPEYEKKIIENKMSSFEAARVLINKYFKNKLI